MSRNNQSFSMDFPITEDDADYPFSNLHPTDEEEDFVENVFSDDFRPSKEGAPVSSSVSDLNWTDAYHQAAVVNSMVNRRSVDPRVSLGSKHHDSPSRSTFPFRPGWPDPHPLVEDSLPNQFQGLESNQFTSRTASPSLMSPVLGSISVATSGSLSSSCGLGEAEFSERSVRCAARPLVDNSVAQSPVYSSSSSPGKNRQGVRKKAIRKDHRDSPKSDSSELTLSPSSASPFSIGKRRGRPPKTIKRPQNPDAALMKQYWARSLDGILEIMSPEEKFAFNEESLQVETEYNSFDAHSKDSKNKHRDFWTMHVETSELYQQSKDLVRFARMGGQNSLCADVTKSFCALLRTIQRMIPDPRRSSVIERCQKIAVLVNNDPHCFWKLSELM
eukprot:TRINITY_DN758_c0_g1_i1.p1 TRINITY_DN758_c0_g1~~TRINITY_DN758_c0_g1_i1.p1  ORF type:complete len:388 (+),score=60.42 TRINITY_DN758_c0_g1_i1:51-1214(+)